MKILLLFMTAGLLHVSAAGTAQTVTLAGSNLPFEKVLDAIRQQAGYEVAVELAHLRQAKPVTVKAENMPVEAFLDLVLQGQPMEAKVANKTIYLSRKEATSSHSTTGVPKVGMPNEPPNENLNLAFPEVRGKVVDSLGNPLSGASIRVLDAEGNRTSLQTQTDRNGEFVLKNVPEGAVLEIAYIGYLTLEIKAIANIGTVVLRSSPSALEEVVVSTGYWETSRKMSPGNITKVIASDIDRQPVSNPLATLQALVPGMEIIQQNGVPGGGFTVRIRGRNSIGNGNEPLYVIDGVPFTSTAMTSANASGEILPQDGLNAGGVSPLNYLNPADIESIEVLKDASATAIYGSRGSNGVVLITTKKGKPGKTQVTMNVYSGFSRVPRFIDLLNREQYMTMRREAKQNDNAPVNASDYDLNGTWDTTRHTDWQKELIGGTAKITDAQLAFSGGAELIQFTLGGGYHRETTVFPGKDADQRIAAHFSLTNISRDKKLKITTSVNYSAGKSNLLGADLTGNAVTLVPVAPALYDDTGNLNWENNSWENPLRYLKRQYSSNTVNLIGNSVLTYEFFTGLRFRANVGVTNTKLDAINVQPKSANSPTQAEAIEHRSVFANTDFRNWIAEPQLTYSKPIGNGQLELLAGASLFEQIRAAKTMTGIGFSSEALMKNLGAATTIRGGNTYEQYRYGSALGRINYTYDNKYIIDLTGRRDGSSRFGPGKQFANFGAIGAAWIFSDQAFVKQKMPYLSYGKLRSSLGLTGNDQLGDYEYLDTYRPVVATGYMGSVGLAPVRLSNPTFAWETNVKFETGLELGFVDDRFTAEISYYHNRSSNQLIGYSLPPTTGFTSIRANLPATVQNSGFEFLLTSVNIDRSDFKWKAMLNLSIPRNKLVEFPNLEGSPTYANMFVVGEPTSIRKLYRHLGVDSNTGIHQFEDINDDGRLNQDDRHIIKNLGRTCYGGMQNTLQYNGVELIFLIQVVRQLGMNPRSGTPGYPTQLNQLFLDRWRRVGDETDVQRFGVSNPIFTAFENYMVSDAYVIDKSFLRLKNLSLSYTFMDKCIKRINIGQARVFLQAQNLFTLTRFKGFDPETADLTLPALRTVAIGLSITY